MKLALFLISTVFLFLVSAQEADQTEVADSNYDVQSSNVQLLRQEREAKKRKVDKRKRKSRGGKKAKKTMKDKDRKYGKKRKGGNKKKGKNGKKKGKKSKKDRKQNKRNKKRGNKSANREKLILCCCKQKENCIEKPDLDATICVEKICLKEGEKTCPKLFFECKPDNPTPVPPPHGPPTPVGPCPAPPPPCPNCADDIAKKMKEFKKATNFLKQWKRAQIFLGRIEKKAGKSDAFNDGAMALGSATKNGTMCAGGPSDPMATEAYNVLKDCEKNIKDDCKCSVKLPECKRASITRQASTPAPAPAASPAPGVSPAPAASPAPGASPAPAVSPAPAPIQAPAPSGTSKCPKDLQNVVDETNKCLTKTGDALCMCFENLPKIPDCCNIQTELKEITACNTKCQGTWSKCSGKLKEAGPLVDKCECDCMKPIPTPATSGRRLFLNLRDFKHRDV